MKRKHILSVLAAGIIVLGGSIANADVILTVNGENPAGAPLMIEGIGPFLVAVDGNTPVGPNDVSVAATGGTLVELPGVNNQYHFKFDAESTFGNALLIANVDISIEGRFVPAGTTICQLYFFCDREANIISVLYAGLPDIIPSEEEQGEQYEEETGELPAVIKDEETIGNEPEGGGGGPSTTLGAGEMLLDNVIEITDNITTNQIWTADNRYRINGWNYCVAVYALLVIEPGTVIEFMPNKELGVSNGGCLISAGTPDKPIIYTRADSNQSYWHAISISGNASTQTKITYSHFYGAETAVYLYNVRLDHPIENNYFYNNENGISVNGWDRHTDIINNLFEQTSDTAIKAGIYMGEVKGSKCVQYFNSDIAIQNNTCDGQKYGIWLDGPILPDYAGRVVIANNIISRSSSYGLCGNGYFYPLIACNGYYSNAVNICVDFEEVEYNPVYEANFPFIAGPDGTYYLRTDCNFVNNGYEYIEQTPLIGKTTDVNRSPDSNFTDIGYHYPNWDYSNPGLGNSLSADLDDSKVVDFKDFTELANYWWQSASADADLDDNGFVDCNDLDILAEQWLKTADPNIQIKISGDSNNGYVDFGAAGYSLDTRRIFLLADGKYVGEIIRFKDDYTLTTDISDSNGLMEVKLIDVDKFGRITCSDVNKAKFQRTLNYCVLPETYEKGSSLPFAAYNSGAGDITVKVYAGGGNLVWSQTFSGNSILGSIPAAITADQNDIDYVSFDDSNDLSIAKKITDPNEPDDSANVQALIVLPDWLLRLYDSQTPWFIEEALKFRGIIYAKLSGKKATYDKIAWYAQNKNIKYLYISAHGHFWIDPDDGIFRTVVYLYPNEAVVSIKRSDFCDPNSAPFWCVDLKGRDEDEKKSFYSMGFDSLEFAYFDTCYSGRLMINDNDELVFGQPGQMGIVFDSPISDMSLALGMHEPSRSRVYQGWYDIPFTKFWPFETDYQQWTQDEWMWLGLGGNLSEAINDAISRQEHFSDVNDPVNCYRLKGQGNIEDVILRNW
ncbi:MAG: hypothetical protein JW749_04735 [Sedimentisphaerales bacterium]|nr:hypothetical protein [Sedimentisphaerales bacterium]